MGGMRPLLPWGPGGMPRPPLPGAPPLPPGDSAPPLPGAPPPAPEDEREAKRQRMEGGFVLEAEEEFLEKFPGE